MSEFSSVTPLAPMPTESEPKSSTEPRKPSTTTTITFATTTSTSSCGHVLLFFESYDLVSELAPHLTTDSKFNVILTCRRWHDIFVSFLWKNVETIVELQTDIPTYRYGAIIQTVKLTSLLGARFPGLNELLTCCPHIRQIQLDDILELSPTNLRDILQALCSLQQLTLKDMSGYSNQDLGVYLDVLAAYHPPTLSEIGLHFPQALISYEAVSRFLKTYGSKGLQKITLRDFIFTPNRPSVTVLSDLESNWRDDLIESFPPFGRLPTLPPPLQPTSGTTIAATTATANLLYLPPALSPPFTVSYIQTMAFEGCTHESGAFDDILSQTPFLKNLSFTGNMRSLNDKTIQMVIDFCPELEMIDLKGNDTITGTGLKNLVSMNISTDQRNRPQQQRRSVWKLKHLNLSRTRVNDSVLSVLADHHEHHLEHLFLDFCEQTTVGGIQEFVLAKLPKLRSLGLRHMERRKCALFSQVRPVYVSAPSFSGLGGGINHNNALPTVNALPSQPPPMTRQEFNECHETTGDISGWACASSLTFLDIRCNVRYLTSLQSPTALNIASHLFRLTTLEQQQQMGLLLQQHYQQQRHQRKHICRDFWQLPNQFRDLKQLRELMVSWDPDSDEQDLVPPSEVMPTSYNRERTVSEPHRVSNPSLEEVSQLCMARVSAFYNPLIDKQSRQHWQEESDKQENQQKTGYLNREEVETTMKIVQVSITLSNSVRWGPSFEGEEIQAKWTWTLLRSFPYMRRLQTEENENSFRRVSRHLLNRSGVIGKTFEDDPLW